MRRNDGRLIVLINDAPNVAQYVLTRVAQRGVREKVIVLVTESCGLDGFLQIALSTAENVKVSLLPDPPRIRTSSPKTFLALRRLLNATWNTLACAGYPDEVWYFSDFCNVAVAGLVAWASRRGVRVIDAGHAQYALRPLDKTPADFVYCLLMKAWLGVPQRLVSTGGLQRQRFLDSDQIVVSRIPAPVSQALLAPFLYRCVEPTSGSSRGVPLLLFESGSGANIYRDYELRVTDLVGRLQQMGFAIYVKPHPRLGASSFLKKIPNLAWIPQEIPGELLDYSPFQIAVGIYSVALVHTAAQGISSYCLEHLLERYDVSAVEADLSRLRSDPRLPASSQLWFPMCVDDLIVQLNS